MSEFKVSELARNDLLEIFGHIALENPIAATKLMQKFRDKFKLLAQFPNMGRERNDLMLYLRAFPVEKYLVFCEPIEDGVEILRVRHGARDLQDLFKI